MNCELQYFSFSLTIFLKILYTVLEMEKEQIVHPRTEREEKGYFVQNNLFDYWTPGTGTDYQDSYTKLFTPGAGYIPQNYDFFPDLSLEFHEEELRLLHADNAGIALVGGAGTGKTYALSSLAGYWIREGIFHADEVLVITFTDSESRELALRILKTAGQSGSGVEVTGIDEFCFKLLCMVYGTTPRIFDIHDRKHFIDLIFPFLSNKAAEMLCSFIALKEIEGSRDPEEDFPHLRDTYLDSLNNIKVCDRGVLAVQAALALTNNPGTLFSVRQKYKCIMIDDLQRMDTYQYDLLSRFVMQNIIIETNPGRIQKIVVSVDPLQKDGYTVRKHICEMFLSDYVRRRFFLNKSWRIPGRILSSVSRLYGKEKRKKKKVPKTHKKRGAHILLYRAKDPGEEAAFIVDTILSLVKKKKGHTSGECSWKDFGIFSRQTEDFKEITAFLARAHIPFILHNRHSITEAKPFHQINSLLYFILSERDVAAFADILLNLFNDFSIGEVKNIFLAGNRKDEPLSGLVQRLYNEQILSDSQYTGIIRLFRINKKIRKQVFESGITAGIALLCSEFPGLEVLLINVPEKRRLYLEWADSCGMDIKKFLTGQQFLYTGNHGKQQLNRVHLSLFHYTKGLELPVLFIPGMEEGNCPLYNTSPDIETETGLFYSAITRAKERVYLSFAESRSGEKKEVSSFIREMGSHVKEIDPAPVSGEPFEQRALF